MGHNFNVIADNYRRAPRRRAKAWPSGCPGWAGGWGPALVGGTVSANEVLLRLAVPELGGGAPRLFRLSFGMAAFDGRTVLLAVRRVEPRAKAGRLPDTGGPRTRWAVIDLVEASVIFSLDEDIATAAWDGPTAIASRAGSFFLWSRQGTRTLPVEDGTVAHSLAPMGDGRWVAGMASGHVITFDEHGAQANFRAHSSPVTALAYDHVTRSLATGGQDGRIAVRASAGTKSELDFGQPVEALTWLGAGRLVAKVGGAGGRLVVVRPD